MYRRRDANLRVDKLTAMVKASQIRSPNNGASDRAREGQPQEVDGDLLHAISFGTAATALGA